MVERLVETPPDIEINFSMQNLLDKSSVWAIITPVAPVEFHAYIARWAGYSGIEYFPWRRPDWQARRGAISQDGLSSIKSAHQSWRSERSLREVARHPNRLLAAFAYVTLPEKSASLPGLKKLQDMLGQDLPLVIHPYDEWRGDEQYPLFGQLRNKLAQPEPALLGRWGIKSAGDLAREIKRRGFDGLCLDLYHLRRPAGQVFKTRFGPWQEVIPVLLPHTKEIHLGLGRSDIPAEFNSMQELKDLYGWERKTDIIPILEMIRDLGWRGPIVTEIPVKAIRELAGAKILTPRRLVSTHKVIVQNLKEIMGRQPPSPHLP